MTTIAVRSGIMAADSRVTYESEAAGSRFFRTEKIFRVGKDLIGLAGESEPGLIFLDWYRAGALLKDRPGVLIDGEADFTAIVLTRKGMFEYGKYCIGERVLEPFYAIGSGCKAALGAMHVGADATRAVKVACKVDTYSALPVVWMKL